MRKVYCLRKLLIFNWAVCSGQRSAVSGQRSGNRPAGRFLGFQGSNPRCRRSFVRRGPNFVDDGQNLSRRGSNFVDGGPNLFRCGQDLFDDGQTFVRRRQNSVDGGQNLLRRGQNLLHDGQYLFRRGPNPVDDGANLFHGGNDGTAGEPTTSIISPWHRFLSLGTARTRKASLCAGTHPA